MDFLYSLPAALVLVCALVIAIAIAVAGQLLVHRRFKQADFVGHNEVGGVMIAVAGTLYAVILGFMTVVCWEHFEQARQIVVAEADACIDAWHLSVGLPPAARARVRQDMIDYAGIMAGTEWERMKHGAFDEKPAMISMDAIEAVGSVVPANGGEANAQTATMEQLTVLHDSRQRRIGENYSGVSWFEWVVLLGGAACIVGFCWLFGVRNAAIHLLMTSAVAVIIVCALVLLFELQYPFRSDIRIQPIAWRGAVAHINLMRSGEQTGMRM
jgi:hypothetical protein